MSKQVFGIVEQRKLKWYGCIQGNSNESWPDLGGYKNVIRSIAGKEVGLEEIRDRMWRWIQEQEFTGY